MTTKVLKMKPAPPDDLADCLAALGAPDTDARSTEERVFDALVAFWREHGRSPSNIEVAQSAGIPPSSCCTVLSRLVSLGRVRRPRRGFYVPDVRKSVDHFSQSARENIQEK